MKKRVLLFAAAKECVGRDSVDVDLEDNATVADLRKRLLSEYPELEELMGRSFISVDQKYVSDDHAIVDAKEIAMIPPVSGG